MTTEAPAVSRSVVRQALARVEVPEQHRFSAADATITHVDGGVNDVFFVGGPDHDEFVVKFAAYSTRAHFRAGVAAYRLLAEYTDLPVPTVYAFEENPAETPPFVVMERLPGEELAADFRDVASVTAPDAVRILGAVVGEFATIPESATDGYGPIQSFDDDGSGPRAVANFDDCATMLVEYGETLYDGSPDHDALEEIVPAVPEFLRANRDRFPTEPTPSVVITDLSPQNLLSRDGTPPDGIDGVTGVFDLERAKIGPLEFTAINTEYLLSRYVSDPDPVREALYDPLPFDSDVPARDLYRLIAMGRSVNALARWYDPGTLEYRHRGQELATEIRRIVENRPPR
ncbi:phosphotransferase family protein [Halorussus halophilus]|uniref:phosphotransferase family protein n=1 Tax=Halorussus halophilus TaxID=2650975 RepID=UPI001300D304|nr:aminoglycoside phosphotransferase family protein [Halorussus halophilus]